MTVKQVAEEFKVTPEAVRQQLKRYKKDLSGHVLKQGRTQILDDFAVEFLREHRNSNPIIVGQSEKAAQFEQVRDQNTFLLAKVAEQADKIAAQSEELRRFDKLQLESGEKLRQAEERADQAETRAGQAEGRADQLAEDLRQARAELDAEKQRRISWKEFWRRRKGQEYVAD